MDAKPPWTPPAPPAEAGPARWQAWLLRAAREPLVHFLAIGLVLLAAAHAWRTAHDERRIVVTDETVAALAAKHRLQFGRDPQPAEREGLVAAYVEEEILYREGRAMGLDRDDEIVRRRIAQKVEFLRQDLAIPPEPSEAELRRWFADHADRYAEPARVSFRHLYFSPDAGGPQAARARAAQALARLSAGAGAERVGADPFPDRPQYAAVTSAEAARIFGNSPMVKGLAQAPVGRWTGPLRSGYGWHLVLAEARYPPQPGDFERQRERVRGDYLAAAQAAANARAMAELRARYAVVRRDARAP